MNLYEHTIVARQDASPSQIKDLVEKYSEIVKKNKGKIIKVKIVLFKCMMKSSKIFLITI